MKYALKLCAFFYVLSGIIWYLAILLCFRDTVPLANFGLPLINKVFAPLLQAGNQWRVSLLQASNQWHVSLLEFRPLIVLSFSHIFSGFHHIFPCDETLSRYIYSTQGKCIYSGFHHIFSHLLSDLSAFSHLPIFCPPHQIFLGFHHIFSHLLSDLSSFSHLPRASYISFR